MRLTDEMRSQLARASVIGEAPAMTIDKGGFTTHSKPGDVVPFRSGDALFDTLAHSFVGCRTERDQQLAEQRGRMMLENALKAPPPPTEAMMRETVHWKRQIANSDKSVTDAAQFYGISRKTVYSYRARYREDEAA